MLEEPEAQGVTAGRGIGLVAGLVVLGDRTGKRSALAVEGAEVTVHSTVEKEVAVAVVIESWVRQAALNRCLGLSGRERTEMIFRASRTAWHKDPTQEVEMWQQVSDTGRLVEEVEEANREPGVVAVVVGEEGMVTEDIVGMVM